MQRKTDLFFPDESFPFIIHRESRSYALTPTESLGAIHEAIEIKYFYEGNSTLLIGNKTVRAEAGDVIVINPYELHSTVDCGDGCTGRYHCLMIGLDILEGMRSTGADLRRLLFSGGLLFQTKQTPRDSLSRILTDIVEESKRDDGLTRLYLHALIAELLAELLRNGTERREDSPSEDMIKGYSLIEPAIRLMRDCYREPFTVERLAEACNISKYHFSRVFKAITSESPMQYLISYRLAIAETLLLSTEMRVSEVAEAVGFSDVCYFSRIYKKRLGKAPGARMKSKPREGCNNPA